MIKSTGIKITISCEYKKPTDYRRSIAGTLGTTAWWESFKYWMISRMAGEGLDINSIEITMPILVEDSLEDLLPDAKSILPTSDVGDVHLVSFPGDLEK